MKQDISEDEHVIFKDYTDTVVRNLIENVNVKLMKV